MSELRQNDQCHELERPLHKTYRESMHKDQTLCYRRLIEDSSRLFTHQSENFDIIRVLISGNGRASFQSASIESNQKSD
jgi:hypothetical protein